MGRRFAAQTTFLTVYWIGLVLLIVGMSVDTQPLIDWLTGYKEEALDPDTGGEVGTGRTAAVILAEASDYWTPDGMTFSGGSLTSWTSTVNSASLTRTSTGTATEIKTVSGDSALVLTGESVEVSDPQLPTGGTCTVIWWARAPNYVHGGASDRVGWLLGVNAGCNSSINQDVSDEASPYGVQTHIPCRDIYNTGDLADGSPSDWFSCTMRFTQGTGVAQFFNANEVTPTGFNTWAPAVTYVGRLSIGGTYYEDPHTAEGQYVFWGFWPSALSDADITTMHNYLNSTYNALADPVPTYGVASIDAYLGFPITTQTPTDSAGTAVSWGISPDLNAQTGLAFNTSTGAISGTPTTTVDSTVYTVTATNSGAGTGQTTITIASNAAPAASLARSAYVFRENEQVSLTPSANFTPSSWSIDPTLPPGLELNSATGTIAGRPTTDQAALDYTLVPVPPAGTTVDSIVFSIEVLNELVPIGDDDYEIVYDTSNFVGHVGKVTFYNPEFRRNGAPVLAAALPFTLNFELAAGAPSFVSINAATGAVVLQGSALTQTFSGSLIYESTDENFYDELPVTFRMNGEFYYVDDETTRIKVRKGTSIEYFPQAIVGTGQFSLRSSLVPRVAAADSKDLSQRTGVDYEVKLGDLTLDRLSGRLTGKFLSNEPLTLAIVYTADGTDRYDCLQRLEPTDKNKIVPYVGGTMAATSVMAYVVGSKVASIRNCGTEHKLFNGIWYRRR